MHTDVAGYVLKLLDLMSCKKLIRPLLQGLQIAGFGHPPCAATVLCTVLPCFTEPAALG